jgi:hypothetical protein
VAVLLEFSGQGILLLEGRWLAWGQYNTSRLLLLEGVQLCIGCRTMCGVCEWQHSEQINKSIVAAVLAGWPQKCWGAVCMEVLLQACCNV